MLDTLRILARTNSCIDMYVIILISIRCLHSTFKEWVVGVGVAGWLGGLGNV